MVLYEFPPKCFKTWERYGIALSGSLCGEKKFLLIFIPFYRFDQKKLFKQIQIFLWICPFSDMVRKTNFLSIPVFVSEIITFLTKKSIFLWISLKMLQNNRKHSLAVCGSLWWGKQFLLIFIPFYRFDQKQLVKQIQIFLWICPFSNMVRKTNFVSISVFVYEIITFLNKKRGFLWISLKNASKQQKGIV